MIKFFDISPKLGPLTPAWPTDPPVEFESFKSLDAGGSSNVTRISMGTHAGSHIDAPRHFVPGGQAVDDVPLDVLIGPALVIAIEGDIIDAAALKPVWRAGSATRVLFKTANSRLWSRSDFTPHFTGLSADGADFLVEAGVRLVGIDYLSIEASHSQGAPAHKRLLESGVIIVESLDLSSVPPGEYELLCLPLRLSGLDGAPARVVLRA